MFDFNFKVFYRLRSVPIDRTDSTIQDLLNNEMIISSYQSICDSVIFTNKRIIAKYSYGLFKMKTKITSLPYSKIQVYSIKSYDDPDKEIKLMLWFSDFGKIVFKFQNNLDESEIIRIISGHAL